MNIHTHGDYYIYIYRCIYNIYIHIILLATQHANLKKVRRFNAVNPDRDLTSLNYFLAQRSLQGSGAKISDSNLAKGST